MFAHQPRAAAALSLHTFLYASSVCVCVFKRLQKADKSALENKVSRLQFDSATEQLNSMFHELLNKVTGQEQDWRQVMDRLSTEMECKVRRNL